MILDISLRRAVCVNGRKREEMMLSSLNSSLCLGAEGPGIRIGRYSEKERCYGTCLLKQGPVLHTYMLAGVCIRSRIPPKELAREKDHPKSCVLSRTCRLYSEDFSDSLIDTNSHVMKEAHKDTLLKCW